MYSYVFYRYLSFVLIHFYSVYHNFSLCVISCHNTACGPKLAQILNPTEIIIIEIGKVILHYTSKVKDSYQRINPKQIQAAEDMSDDRCCLLCQGNFPMLNMHPTGLPTP